LRSAHPEQHLDRLVVSGVDMPRQVVGRRRPLDAAEAEVADDLNQPIDHVFGHNALPSLERIAACLGSRRYWAREDIWAVNLGA